MSDTEEYGQPIFVITDTTEVRQIWFVGSPERDVMGMLYKDEEGWVLKYRWRHYAEAVSDWDPDGTVEQTAFDGRDQKASYTVRPRSNTCGELELAGLAEAFTRVMEKIAAAMGDNVTVWTQHVTTGQEVIDILMKAPWAHTKSVPLEKPC